MVLADSLFALWCNFRCLLNYTFLISTISSWQRKKLSYPTVCFVAAPDRPSVHVRPCLHTIQLDQAIRRWRHPRLLWSRWSSDVPDRSFRCIMGKYIVLIYLCLFQPGCPCFVTVPQDHLKSLLTWGLVGQAVWLGELSLIAFWWWTDTHSLGFPRTWGWQEVTHLKYSSAQLTHSTWS